MGLQKKAIQFFFHLPSMLFFSIQTYFYLLLTFEWVPNLVIYLNKMRSIIINLPKIAIDFLAYLLFILINTPWAFT